MSALDLDKLRERWSEQGRALDRELVLDVTALRAALSRKTHSAFAWHRRWLLMAMVIGTGCLAGLLAFIGAHWGQWDWVGVAALLLPMLLAEFGVDLLQWRAMRRLDLDGPVVAVRERLHELRARRLRLARGYLLLSVLLWWPFVLVLLKGLFGVDLLRWLPPAVFWWQIAVGLGFMPVAVAVAWWVRRRFGQSPGWQRFLDDLAGKCWRLASDELGAREAFEAAVQDGSLEAALQASVLPEPVLATIRALRRRLLLGILASAAVVVAMGLFNGAHGGQVIYIVSGVALLWAALAQMIPQIVHRIALTTPAGGRDALRDRLRGMVALRLRVARVSIVAAPLLALPLAIVLARLLAGWNLVQLLPWPASVAAAALALAGSLALAWQWHRHRDTFAAKAADRLCLGMLARSRELVARLERD